MSAESQKFDYRNLLAAGAASLDEGEYWVILDRSGRPFEDTASKRFDVPVLIFCAAMEIDWDDALDSGYRMGTGAFKYEVTADAILETMRKKETRG